MGSSSDAAALFMPCSKSPSPVAKSRLWRTEDIGDESDHHFAHELRTTRNGATLHTLCKPGKEKAIFAPTVGTVPPLPLFAISSRAAVVCNVCEMSLATCLSLVQKDWASTIEKKKKISALLGKPLIKMSPWTLSRFRPPTEPIAAWWWSYAGFCDGCEVVSDLHTVRTHMERRSNELNTTVQRSWRTWYTYPIVSIELCARFFAYQSFDTSADVRERRLQRFFPAWRLSAHPVTDRNDINSRTWRIYSEKPERCDKP